MIVLPIFVLRSSKALFFTSNTRIMKAINKDFQNIELRAYSGYLTDEFKDKNRYVVLVNGHDEEGEHMSLRDALSLFNELIEDLKAMEFQKEIEQYSKGVYVEMFGSNHVFIIVDTFIGQNSNDKMYDRFLMATIREVSKNGKYLKSKKNEVKPLACFGDSGFSPFCDIVDLATTSNTAKVEKIKQGELVKRKADSKYCFLRGAYIRELKKYELIPWNSKGEAIYIKKGTILFTDWDTTNED